MGDRPEVRARDPLKQRKPQWSARLRPEILVGRVQARRRRWLANGRLSQSRGGRKKGQPRPTEVTRPLLRPEVLYSCFDYVSRGNHAICENYSVSADTAALAILVICIRCAALRRRVADHRLLPGGEGRSGLFFSVRQHRERRRPPWPARHRGRTRLAANRRHDPARWQGFALCQRPNRFQGGTRREAPSTATTSRPISTARQEPARVSRAVPARSSSPSNERHCP
jgi:hypothetical protein